MTETSRSPYSVSASVRGIGVAVITRTSGCQSLVAKRRALQHAEPMLFVDDDEAQLLESHVALHQRMGADHQVHGCRLRSRPAAVVCAAAVVAPVSSATRNRDACEQSRRC